MTCDPGLYSQQERKAMYDVIGTICEIRVKL